MYVNELESKFYLCSQDIAKNTFKNGISACQIIDVLSGIFESQRVTITITYHWNLQFRCCLLFLSFLIIEYKADEMMSHAYFI